MTVFKLGDKVLLKEYGITGTVTTISEDGMKVSVLTSKGVFMQPAILLELWANIDRVARLIIRILSLFKRHAR